MGRDSNPRWGLTHAGFQDRCLKPLGHPSNHCRATTASFGAGWNLAARAIDHKMARDAVIERSTQDRGRCAQPAVGLVLSAALALTSCAKTETQAARPQLEPMRAPAPVAAVDPTYGVSPSPRLAVPGGIMQSGGGGYKLGKPYQVAGRWYVPREDPGYDQAGTASWYGTDFHGRKTANGEIFDMNALSAAHPTLIRPLPVPPRSQCRRP